MGKLLFVSCLIVKICQGKIMNLKRKEVTMTDIEIGDVAATSFVTLYCHAIESQSKDPILDDPKAVEITHDCYRERPLY